MTVWLCVCVGCVQPKSAAAKGLKKDQVRGWVSFFFFERKVGGGVDNKPRQRSTLELHGWSFDQPPLLSAIALHMCDLDALECGAAVTGMGLGWATLLQWAAQYKITKTRGEWEEGRKVRDVGPCPTTRWSLPCALCLCPAFPPILPPSFS